MNEESRTTNVMKLRELEAGELFRLADNPSVLAVKSEYAYDNEYHACLCVLLASGEYAHFCQDDGISTAARVYRHEETPVIPIDIEALIESRDALAVACQKALDTITGNSVGGAISTEIALRDALAKAGGAL